MSWVRLDDGFATHPKILGLTDEAFRLHISGMCYTSQHNRDGWLPEAFVSGHEEALTELREDGIWEDDPVNGYYIHDFLVYNPSSVDRRSRSEAASQAATARWAKQTDSDAQATPMQNGKTAHASRMHPVLGAGDGGSGVGLVLKSKDAFERFWAVYPRKRSKAGARKKFDLAVKQGADVDDIIAGAERYRDDPNREPEYTKDPTTWLNNGCWEDEPLPVRRGRGRSVQNLLDLADRMES